MTTTETPVDNGVNVAALLGARSAIEETPEAAAFQWRAESEWVHGVHTTTRIEDYSGFGGEQSHVKEFAYDTDHPELFAATDQGVTPVELVLVGLAGCLTAGVASVATNRGIQLRSVKATLEGDMDMHGILGIDKSVRNGFGQVRVTFEIDADASRDDIVALVSQSQRRSAVYDAVANPTDIVIEVA